MMLLDGGLGHLLKEKGLRIPGLPYDQQFLAGVLVSTIYTPQSCMRTLLILHSKESSRRLAG
jgi:hypothetical protein